MGLAAGSGLATGVGLATGAGQAARVLVPVGLWAGVLVELYTFAAMANHVCVSKGFATDSDSESHSCAKSIY